ncbi:MAG: hypothetical protein ACAH95_05080 [Fimbriimonas sp.]
MLLFFCLGCGGSSAKPSAEGTLRLSIEWPEQSRLVPIASKSVVINVIIKKGEGEYEVTERIAQKIIPRLATGNLSKVEIRLPSTKLTIQADASPNEDGSGNIQATASKEVNIPESQTLPVAITMVTRIQQVKMTPNPDGSSLLIGSTGTYDATAESDGDVLVVTSPSKWTWTVSDPTLLSMTATGSKVTVKGLKKGRVTLTATEEESHRTKSAVIDVTAPDETVRIPDGRYEGLVTYTIYTSSGTSTRKQREAMVLSDNYINHFDVIGPDWPDHFLASLNQAVTKRQPDGSISFDTQGYVDDYWGGPRGDYCTVTGAYQDGNLSVSIEYFRDNIPSQWRSGSGTLFPKD